MWLPRSRLELGLELAYASPNLAHVSHAPHRASPGARGRRRRRRRRPMATSSRSFGGCASASARGTRARASPRPSEVRLERPNPRPSWPSALSLRRPRWDYPVLPLPLACLPLVALPPPLLAQRTLARVPTGQASCPSCSGRARTRARGMRASRSRLSRGPHRPTATRQARAATLTSSSGPSRTRCPTTARIASSKPPCRCARVKAALDWFAPRVLAIACDWLGCGFLISRGHTPAPAVDGAWRLG